jgi:hypothetical protein
VKKTILTYGVISGLVSAGLMLATVPFMKVGFDRGYVIGYTAIVLSFLLVWFGIRSYRDNVGQGQITFARAFGVGIAITVISCVFYVVTWEILYFTVMNDFAEKYGAYMVAKAQAAGAGPAVIQAKIAEAQRMKVSLDNPLINSAMTFLEPFPVGLLMTLISAGVLRKKRVAGAGGNEAAVVAS